jgi:hypothetical protein
MAKFCSECGNPTTGDNISFCSKCGAKLPISSPDTQNSETPQKPEPNKQKLYDFLGIKEDNETKKLDFRFGIDAIDNSLNTLEKKVVDNSPNTTEKNNRVKSISSTLNIIAGVIIILILYIYPVTSFQERNLSIADLQTLCNSVVGIALGGSNCNIWNMLFYGGWLIGIICILYGVVDYSKIK